MPGAHIATLSLPLLNWTEEKKKEKNMMKGLWVDIRTGTDHSSTTVMGKTH